MRLRYAATLQFISISFRSECRGKIAKADLAAICCRSVASDLLGCLGLECNRTIAQTNLAVVSGCRVTRDFPRCFGLESDGAIAKAHLAAVSGGFIGLRAHELVRGILHADLPL